MKRFTVTVLAALALSGCATGYSSKGLTGGFSETRLGERSYQVRFEGNGLASQERVSSFLLRRCAELTLENGFRWFALAGTTGGATTSGAYGFVASYPNREATVKFLEKEADDPTPIDSVFVVRETEARAGGRLSEKAVLHLRALEGKAVPLAAGTKLYDPAGALYGEVLETVLGRKSLDGSVQDSVQVKKANGEKVWIALSEALRLRAEPPAPVKR